MDFLQLAIYEVPQSACVSARHGGSKNGIAFDES
jgi:hypothetical protein